MWPSSWKARMRWSGIPCPTWYVRRGDVDPELHPQRPAEGELALELACGQHVDGVSGELGEAPMCRRRHYSSPNLAFAPPQTIHAAPTKRGAGSASSAYSAPHGRSLRAGVARRSPSASSRPWRARHRSCDPARQRHQVNSTDLRLDGKRDPRRAARNGEPRPRGLRRHLAADEAGDRRGRGPALLRASRRGHARRSAARSGRTSGNKGVVQGGSTITQQFIKNTYVRHQPHDRPQGARGDPRLAARAALVEEEDPHRVPEHRSTSGTAPTASTRPRGPTSATARRR